MKKVFIYHLHSDYSSSTTNIDSATKVSMYVDRAKELGMESLAFSEHGNLYNWYEKKDKIESAGMKYVHAMEAYITNGIDEKVRDNYHCVLLARNYDGFLELNRIMTNSYNKEDGHFYYVPRITIEELENTSNNILVTTACLGSILNRGNDSIKNRYIDFLKNNRNRCFLEIQHHNVEDQKRYNVYLSKLSKEIDVPLIAGTDTHSLNDELADARVILQKSKNIFFGEEDGWDLTFKSYDELVKSYELQNTLPEDIYLQAIENTNVLSDMVEPFEIDKVPKYPKIYENSEEEMKKEAYKAIEEHPYALKNHSYETLKERVDMELEGFSKSKINDFILFQKFVRDEERKMGVFVGPGRGSITGSEIAYLLNITEMDSIKYRLNFFRFCNPDRVSNAD